MNTKSRQQRRAEAREKAKAEAAIDRVEPALLQLVVSANNKLGAARKAAAEAQGVINYVGAQIRETHKLKEGDGFDLKSGVITRAPRAKSKRKT